MTTTTIFHRIDAATSLAIQSSFPSSPTKLPTLVFLHFWGGSSKSFDKTTSLLSNSFQIHAIDFPGWGVSTGPDSPIDAYNVSSYSSYVQSFLATLPTTSPFVLIGHSMGAKVAQAVAATYEGSNLAGLVLIAPAPLTPLVLPPAMLEQQKTAYGSAASVEFVVNNVLTNGGLSNETLNEVVTEVMKGSKLAKLAWPTIGMAEDLSELSSKIKVRTLVVAGEKDKVKVLERVKREVVEKIVGAELVVLKEVGHLIPVETPKELAGEIDRFVKEL